MEQQLKKHSACDECRMFTLTVILRRKRKSLTAVQVPENSNVRAVRQAASAATETK